MENEKTVVVICENKAELLYMKEFVKEYGDGLSPYSGYPDTYPICICPSGGWTDKMDSALTYLSFSGFVNALF